MSVSRGRSRIDESRATSAARAARGAGPASRNQEMCATSPSSPQVPRTTPPRRTTGAIQPLCLLTAARRAAGTMCPSSVPGPITYWSKPGSSRTSLVGSAEARVIEVVGKDQRRLPIHLDLDQSLADRRKPCAPLLRADPSAIQEVAEVINQG